MATGKGLRKVRARRPIRRGFTLRQILSTRENEMLEALKQL